MSQRKDFRPTDGTAWMPYTGSMTRERWEQIREAFRERPTQSYVRKKTGCGERVAQRAFFAGWPQLGLPPLVPPKPKTHPRETSLARNAEMTRAGEEALGARMALRATTRVLEGAVALAERVMEAVDAGDLRIGDVGPKLLATVARIVDTATAAQERAMKIERMRAGEPDVVVGVQVGMLIQRCTVEELRQIEETGRLPSRIIGLAAPKAPDA